MQRRAAAIYFVFFLVVGAGAYTYIGVAQETHQPQYALDGPVLESGGSVEIDGTEYTVAELGHEGGDHGGDEELVGTLEWTNESFTYEDSFEDNSTMEVENQSYRVVIPNESNPSTFTLREEQNVTQILSNDDAVENSTAERDGTEYVVYRENDTVRPLEEYLPAPETREYAEGDEFEFEGHPATIMNVTSEDVRLQWTAPKDQSAELSEGGNMTLANGEQYFAHFVSEEQVQLVPSDQYAEYAQTNAQRQTFNERLNGLWGIVIISALSALIVLSTAYLPVRG